MAQALSNTHQAIIDQAERSMISNEQALALANCADTAALALAAARLRDSGFGHLVTYSRKVFLPLTQLCRDVCHYCTFAKTPKRIEQAFMSVEQVLSEVRAAEKLGCKEALFTLGERPELRYKAARDALAELGFASTIEYLAHVAGRVLAETNVLPHINAGCMSDEEIALLRPVSASMGIMLESVSERLCEKGMPHHGSPDKQPALRLATIARAGQAAVPFTSGILIGIGETRRERIESLLALRSLHHEFGHLQEIIIQNFRAKHDTKMAQAPEPDLNDLLWTIAVARLIFGEGMSIQAPPNLSPGVLPKLIAAGINDWGGVSPVTPDYVNPEAPWPELARLGKETALSGKALHERLTIYPTFAVAANRWLDSGVRPKVLALIDGEGMPREDQWLTGQGMELPERDMALFNKTHLRISPRIAVILARAQTATGLSEQDITTLFTARDDDFAAVCRVADALRQARCGSDVSYVVNRNINYTNVCYFKCQFCAFSKGKLSENLRGRPYDLSAEELSRRAVEAWERGASELCLQGGIHPEYTGQTYINIVETLRAVTPDIHIHAFSPLEIWQGAETLRLPLGEFLQRLKVAGLDSLPGTAAEILDDEVRAELCPDKINTEQWLEVMAESHRQGLRTTATIMFGHIDNYQSWARHLVAIRDLQRKTGGFTEFVPLPFVASESPIYLKGKARRGPSFRESLLMHAVARLVFNGHIDNIQASWVKMGESGVLACLRSGVNDIGGTLMNESITRAAGASHGEELSPQAMEALIASAGRTARPRNTLYGNANPLQLAKALQAGELQATVNTPASKYERDKKRAVELIAHG
tara:strand:+ start:13492 stop:15957 length:2466 start_codon:yes stop_codon:yes gene_type:complete